jgi:SAM-dependent methyltransferase
MSDESATVDGELDLIVARLRDELTRSAAPSTQAGEGDQDGFVRRRAEAERLWGVRAERPFLYRPGAMGRARGLLLVPLKTVLRKLMRWYVEPLAADQRRFNGALLKLVDSLSELTTDQQAALERRLDGLADELRPRIDAAAAQGRLAVELEERLTRLERRERAAVATSPMAPVEVSAGSAAVPDYFAYESRMRGSTESVREKQRGYVDDFQAAGPVLDLGCGRGEFLGLLREGGIEARGIDLDSDMVAYCQGEGLDVEQAEATEYLERLEDDSLGGIMAAQVFEHLPAATLVRLLTLAAAKLRPGALLVAETINPLSPFALRNYFADLTHVQPLVPETLELLARQSGFASVEARFLNEPEEKLTEPDDPTIASNVRRLNELLFAPLDYAILARK